LSHEGSSPEGWLEPEGGGEKGVAKGFRLEDGAAGEAATGVALRHS
jgi:hypothetical protein